MRRYAFIRSFYPILRFFADAYFLLADALFALYNAFQPIDQIGWASADPLLFISANKAAEMIRRGKLKSFSLISVYIARVKEVNESLNVAAHFNFEAALKEAETVDKHIGQLDEKGREELAISKPLYGVPFTAKDNLWVKGFVTVDGNKWRRKYGKPAESDAEVVAK